MLNEKRNTKINIFANCLVKIIYMLRIKTVNLGKYIKLYEYAI